MTSTWKRLTLKESAPAESAPRQRARPRALAAAALASALLAAAAYCASAHAAASADAADGNAAYAGAARPKLVLSGYEDRAAGSALLAGDYGAVIEALGERGSSFTRDSVAASANLCVAYIMARSWGTAHSACDEAIAAAVRDLPARDLVLRNARKEQIALAYSNRAVLRLLENRPVRAAEDLSRARALSPGSETVARNVEAFRIRSGIREVAAAGR